MNDNQISDLKQVLAQEFGKDKALVLTEKYAKAFDYIGGHNLNIVDTASDIKFIEEVIATNKMVVKLQKFRHLQNADNKKVCLRVFSPNAAIQLSDFLHVIEHMSFRILYEIPYKCNFDKPQNGIKTVWVDEFVLTRMDGSDIDAEKVSQIFENAFYHIWNSEVDNDGYNCLILASGLNWREVEVIRACSKYLRLLGMNLSYDYINSALAAHTDLTKMLIEYFHDKFDPQNYKPKKELKEKENAIMKALDNVYNADHDRIIRSMFNVIDATIRTNYYQKDENGALKKYISFKINCMKIKEMPLPRPKYEIFVFSTRVEGVHLRAAKVARGGIRWSDRMQDYRTEILGLMKAQTVKNAVIVPSGSKGGFIAKKIPFNSSRDEMQKEGIESYKIFIKGLLDLTDNIKNDKVVYPKDVVRYDTEDDTYLVVAADKGTATFSDIANGISKEYDFWLKDAFASGGSNGYDHKAMGITAKGAWESVKRHFREIGKDIQNEDYTCIGVGDMAGDVFGNGMMLSKHTKLIAAFNHMHIFIDPEPDAEASFNERVRLFNLPRSTWVDYDSKLISQGGGVFNRSDKFITLSKQIKSLFKIEEDKITPSELIKTILRHEVELLWFGGIGTFIRASYERDADVGDHHNDSIRVAAKEVKAKIIGEGANLGVTQKARIEFNMLGGKSNTDFIDNSAGVDCSDHEVNIKILLNPLVEQGEISLEDRNKMLSEMTGEVAKLVLNDNYLQSQAISLMQSKGLAIMDDQEQLFRTLEDIALLDREVENLPSSNEMQERMAQGKPLTRPELAILMSYSKIWLFEEIINSNLPDDILLEKTVLQNYFPSKIKKEFSEVIVNHKLKREIITTQIANSIINRVGGTFVTALKEKSSAPTALIAKSYTIGRIAFSMKELWDEIQALDNKISGEAQMRMFLKTNRMMERITLWLLRYGAQNLPLSNMIEKIKTSVEVVGKALDDIIKDLPNGYVNKSAKIYMDLGVPSDLAYKVAKLPMLSSAMDIAEIAKKYNVSIENITRLYFLIGKEFDMGWIWRVLNIKLKVDSHWEKLAISGMQEALLAHQRGITESILEYLKADNSKNDNFDEQKAFDKWYDKNKVMAERLSRLLKEIENNTAVDLSMIIVISQTIRTLIRTSLVYES